MTRTRTNFANIPQRMNKVNGDIPLYFNIEYLLKQFCWVCECLEHDSRIGRSFDATNACKRKRQFLKTFVRKYHRFLNHTKYSNQLI